MNRASAVALVARALARGWWRRPIRLIATVCGGVGGVLLAVAVLTISVPVLQSVRLAPLEAIDPEVVAVSAKAPVGLSAELATGITVATGARSARILMASTNIRGADDYTPARVLGVDTGLPSMLESGARSEDFAPLLPGQVYVPRRWADEHGLAVGDSVEIATPTGARPWRVADVLGDEATGGGTAVIMGIGDLSAAFDRGSAVDILLLRGDAEVAERAREIAGGAALVGPPDEIFAPYSRVFRTPLLLVWMFLLVGLLTGAVVTFLTWRLALADARPVLARLRLIGVRTSDLVLGSGLVMIPMLLCSYVFGAALGVAIGRGLDSIGAQIANFTQQALDSRTGLAIPLAGGFATAVAMFGFAWLSGILGLRRVTAIDAVTGRDQTAVHATGVGRPLAAGAVCFAAGALIVATAGTVASPVWSSLTSAAAVPFLVVAIVVLSVVLPVVAGTVIRRLGSGATTLFVGRQLEVYWRRNAALAITFAIALVTSIAVSGASGSIRGDLEASMVRWTQADVFVQAAPIGQNLADETLPPALADEIRALPGVEGVYAFSMSLMVLGEDRYQVSSLSGDIGRATDARILEGPADVLDHLSGSDIVASSNFARTRSVGVGDSVELPVADGTRTGRVVAIVDDSTSDGGLVYVGADLYRDITGKGVFSFAILVSDGAEAQVTAGLESMLAQRYPRAAVLDRDAYRASVSSALGRLMSSFGVLAWVMFGVAAVVGVTTLASNIFERRRGLVLIALSGDPRPGERLLGAEAAVIAGLAWVIAVPAGLLVTVAMLGVQSLMSGLAPRIDLPLGMIGVSLPVTLVAVACAVWIARRSVASSSPAEVIADE